MFGFIFSIDESDKEVALGLETKEEQEPGIGQK